MLSLYAHFVMLAAILHTVMYLIITATKSIKLSVPTEINRDTNTIRPAHESAHIDNRLPSAGGPDDHSERAKPAIVTGIELPKTMPLVVDPIWRAAGRFVIWKKTGQTVEYREACPAAFVMHRHMIVTAVHCVTLQPARKDQVRLWETNPDTSMYKCVFYQGQNGETVPQIDVDHPDSLKWDIDCSTLPKSFPNGPKDFYAKFLGHFTRKPLANSKSEQLDYAFIPVMKRDDQPANRHFYDLKFSKDHIGQEVLVFGYPKGNDNARKEARVTRGKLQQADVGIIAIGENLIPKTYKQPGFSGAPLVLKNGPDPITGRYAIVGVYSWGNLLSPEFNRDTKAFAENVARSLKAKQD